MTTALNRAMAVTHRVRLESCGNGRVDPRGVVTTVIKVGDGCSLACQVEACGNRIGSFRRHCDDGNQRLGDGL